MQGYISLSFGNWSARMFKPAVEGYSDMLLNRILPIFDDVPGEQRRAVEAVMTSWDCWGEDDYAMIAETAYESSMETAFQFVELRSVFAATGVSGLFHLFEKQVYRHVNHELRRWLAGPISEWRDIRELFKSLDEKDRVPSSELLDILEAQDLRELRLVANSVKHGPGRSYDELISINAPVIQSARLDDDYTVGRHSILGIGISIQPDDIDRYRNAILRFWSLEGDFGSPRSEFP